MIKRASLLAPGALLLTMIIWGIGPVFIRSLSVGLGPANALVIRYTLVTIIYLTGLTLLGRWRIARADWPRLLLISWVGMLGYNLGSAFGFELVPAGIGGLIIGTQPLLIALLGSLLAREPLTPAAVIGIAIAFAGTGLLFWHDLIAAEGGGARLLRGGLYIFLSGLAWAFYVVMSKPLIRAYGFYPIAALSIALATLPMLFLASQDTLDTLHTMTSRDWLNLLYMIVPSTLIATILWNYGASRLPAAAGGAFLYLVPVIAVIAGATMLGEAISPAMILGGVLILTGVAIAQFGPILRMGVLRR